MIFPCGNLPAIFGGKKNPELINALVSASLVALTELPHLAVHRLRAHLQFTEMY